MRLLLYTLFYKTVPIWRVLHPTFKQDACPSNCSVMRWHGVGSGLGVTEGWFKHQVFACCDSVRKSASMSIKWVQQCSQ